MKRIAFNIAIAILLALCVILCVDSYSTENFVQIRLDADQPSGSADRFCLRMGAGADSFFFRQCAAGI